MVLAEWPAFASAYRGTGAPYITVERASNVLAEISKAERTVFGMHPSDLLGRPNADEYGNRRTTHRINTESAPPLSLT